MNLLDSGKGGFVFCCPSIFFAAPLGVFCVFPMYFGALFGISLLKYSPFYSFKKKLKTKKKTSMQSKFSINLPM